MNKRSVIVVAAMSFVCLLVLPSSVSAQQTQAPSHPEVTYDSYHDTSLPVREYSMATPQGPVPREAEHPRPRRILSGATVPVADLAEQTYLAPPVSATIGFDFEGIPNSANGKSLEGVPSDDNLAVGATQVVETINTAWQVYDKATGKSVFGPQQISALFTGLPGLCGQGQTFFWTDPVVLYDQFANRWIISQIAGDNTFGTGNECIAVSESSDATGKYHRYVFKFGNNVLNDYDKLSVWPDAYYANYNLFGPTSFIADDACAYDRAAMLTGAQAKAVCFKNPNEFSFLPSNADGATPPPSGEPSFFVDLSSSTSLHLYRFHVDFANPSKSKFTGPITIPVKAYTMACGGGTCIPQPGTKQQLDSLGDRLMFRLAYRNFTDHESLVVSHSVMTSKAASGERWYEIRDPDGKPKVYQQGTFTHGGDSLWMGSIDMDKAGDMAFGYSESNATTLHPSLAFTGRVPTDPLNTMESPATIFIAKGSATGGNKNGANRWGDYSSMVVDPTDDCTFWYVNQYIPKTFANDPLSFHTRVASLKFPSCQ
jgi:hypothetical protein